MSSELHARHIDSVRGEWVHAFMIAGTGVEGDAGGDGNGKWSTLFPLTNFPHCFIIMATAVNVCVQ